MRVLRAVIGLGILLLTVAALVGTWAYYEWMAPTVAGKIVDKQERIIGARHVAPGRYLSTSFTLLNETTEDRYLYGSPLTTDIHVDQQTYESHAVGASVRVKYLPINPRTARLEGQPLVPRSILLLIAALGIATLTLLFKRTRLVTASAMLITAAVLFSTPGPPSGSVALSAAAALAVVAFAAAIARRGSARMWLLTWAAGTAAVIAWPAVTGAATDSSSAMADVRDVTEFQTPTSSRAQTTLITLQEFDRVHAAFVPQGETQPVFLLDFVDHGSVDGLSEGAKVSVQYNPDAPEAARLVEGQRTHYWKNAAIPVGVALVFGWFTTRERKTGTRATASRTARERV